MNDLRVRGILMEGDKTVLIHRVKQSEEYYVFPGGGLEQGETLEEALRREFKEELGIEIDISNRVYTLTEKDGKKQAFFVCYRRSGEIGTGKGPEFTQYKDRGAYDPVKLKVQDISGLNVLPREVGEQFRLDYLRFRDAKKIPYTELKR